MIFGDTYSYITTIYALFLIIWCQFYLINWKRKCSELMIRWDNFTDEYDKENQRKEFKGIWRKSPVTEKPEKYYPKRSYIIQLLSGILIMIPVFVIATIMNISFMNMDGTIEEGTAFHIPFLRVLANPDYIFAADGVLVNFLPIVQAQCIAFMNAQFHKIAVYTTNRENHKVKSNYENTIILKRYIFEFMDNYMCFFYIAFVNQDFAMLKSSIRMIYIANGLRRFATNNLIPTILSTRKEKLKEYSKDEFITGKKVDSKLIINQLNRGEVEIFDDYMELVIEFGFLTLFAESFILAPIAIVILNKLEKYSDLTRFKNLVKRPEFIRKRNIGMWQYILQVQSVIAIFTNLSLTMMATNDNPQIAYLRSFLRSSRTNKLSFKFTFFAIEHAVILALILVWVGFSPMSKWVKLYLDRRDYKLKSNKWKVLIEDLEIDMKAKLKIEDENNKNIENSDENKKNK